MNLNERMIKGYHNNMTEAELWVLLKQKCEEIDQIYEAIKERQEEMAEQWEDATLRGLEAFGKAAKRSAAELRQAFDEKPNNRLDAVLSDLEAFGKAAERCAAELRQAFDEKRNKETNDD